MDDLQEEQRELRKQLGLPEKETSHVLNPNHPPWRDPYLEKAVV
jgi:hypothetical protein